MNRAILIALLLILASCKKEEPVTPPAPYDPIYYVWTIPQDTGSIAIWVNNEPIEILHDSLCPHNGYMPSSMRYAILDTVPPIDPPRWYFYKSYYPVPFDIRIGDVVRVEAQGHHRVFLPGALMCDVDGSECTYTMGQ